MMQQLVSPCAHQQRTSHVLVMNKKDIVLLQLPVFNLDEGTKTHRLSGNSVLNRITYTTAFEGGLDVNRVHLNTLQSHEVNGSILATDSVGAEIIVTLLLL
jgi:hypothetical protein